MRKHLWFLNLRLLMFAAWWFTGLTSCHTPITVAANHIFSYLACAVKETLISIRTIKALAWERLSYEKLYQARLAVE